MTLSRESCWVIPNGLSKKGREAADTILAFCREHEILLETGGCKVFYSPREWQKRREDYGLKSELIVVYDGGCHRHALCLDAAAEFGYTLYEALNERLRTIGVYMEECTGWYGAIYLGCGFLGKG